MLAPPNRPLDDLLNPLAVVASLGLKVCCQVLAQHVGLFLLCSGKQFIQRHVDYPITMAPTKNCPAALHRKIIAERFSSTFSFACFRLPVGCIFWLARVMDSPA